LKIKSSHTIDVVIAWVDGADLKHKKKRLSFLDNKDVGELAGAAETRFNSLNEVEYCVLSILKFAPFVRNIYIVTDNQDPKIDSAVKKYFPERHKDIRIVDHKEIFEGYEKFLPTFNSICISNMLWRIKGLSNHFVYFNDDIFLLRSIKPEDWFVDSKPVLRGSWSTPPFERLLWDQIKKGVIKLFLPNKKIDLQASFQVNQWTAAKLLGFKFRYFKSGHTPLAMDRNRLENYFKSKPQILEQNISHRFRNYEQFNTVSLANHLEIKAGNENFANSQAIYMQPHNRGDQYVDKKFEECKKDKTKFFACVQSLDLSSSEDQKKVKDAIESILNL